jgi:hypothetical protein
MAGKASGLKGVALIDSGSTDSTVAGTLHFFQDLTSVVCAVSNSVI